MDEAKKGFKWLINQMSEVILYLLGALNVDKYAAEIANAVELDIRIILVCCLLNFESHIAADTSDLRVHSHLMVHVVNSIML